MNKTRLWIVLLVLAAVTLACGLPAPAATVTPSPDDSVSVTAEAPGGEPNAGQGSGTSNHYDTEFPLPDDVSNFSALADGMINFQTKMSLEDALKFYKDALTKEGYTERPLLTITSDTTFSTVYDGHKSGKAIVVQAVDLGNGSVSISIRLQEMN